MMLTTPRLMFAWNVIDFGFSERVLRQLIAWGQEKPKDGESLPIPTMLVNSPGGSLADCWAVIDAVGSLKMPLRTIVMGKAESAALLLATAGTKGERLITEHSMCMIHNYRWPHSSEPDYESMKIRREAEDVLNRQLEDFYVVNTKLSRAKIKSLLKNNVFFDARRAVEWGFMDRILEKNADIGVGSKN